MDNKLFIVRGTGFPIDGTLVKISEVRGDGYCSVTLFRHCHEEPKSILIAEKYLQPIKDREPLSYTFSITKFKDGEKVDSASTTVDSALRDMNIHQLIKKINDDLSPILRMD